MSKVLVIDDDKNLCMLLRATCRSLGYEADFACTLEKGLEMASAGGFEVVLVDVHLPDGSGLDAIPAFRAVSSCPEVIIMTALADSRGAELAIKTGAWDYLQKPAHLSEITLALRRALQYREGVMESRSLTNLDRGSFVAASPLMQHCLGLVAQAAGNTASLLIRGETGTGKEMIARLVHNNSERAALPSWSSIAPTSLRPLSKARCSATKKERLRGPIAAVRGSSNRPMEELSFSMRSGTCLL